MLGSNDSKVQNWQGVDQFRDAYFELLDDYTGSQIILCTPATAYYLDANGNVIREKDDGVTTFGIQPAVVEEIADMVRLLAKDEGYPLVDINDLTYEHPEWFTLDGTHPSEDGANAIANAVYQKIIELQ